MNSNEILSKILSKILIKYKALCGNKYQIKCEYKAKNALLCSFLDISAYKIYEGLKRGCANFCFHFSAVAIFL